MSLILYIWFWITFLRNRGSLPSESQMSHPEITYECLSGAFIWEDEGLWEHKNHHLLDAFKYVIKHRMTLIAGPNIDTGHMRSKRFDKKIFNMAKKHFPSWVGFNVSRCSYNSDLSDRIIRIKKVEAWRINKMMSEE